MTNGKRTVQILGSFALILLVTSLAQASPVIAPIASPFVGGDSANWATYGSGLNSSVANGSTITTPGNVVTITFSDGQAGQIWEENLGSGTDIFNGGVGNGGFSVGEDLLNTNQFITHTPPDTLTLTFATPVTSFGVWLDEYDYDAEFSATLSGLDQDGVTTNSVSGQVNPGSNNAIWLGLSDTGGALKSITLSTSDLTGNDSGYFLIGTAQFNDGLSTPPVNPPPGNPPASGTPEPASLLMVGGGLFGLAWKARKHVRG